MSVNTQNTLSQAQTALRNKAVQSGKGNADLKKDDFMNLFLTQMSNQNPTDPMDSGAMMSQLAQLGSMEQLQNLNSGMDTLNKTQSQVAGFQAMALLEKDVLTEGGKIDVSHGSGQPVHYNLAEEADSMRIVIEGPTGAPVLTEALGMTQAGRHQYVWDGKNDRGAVMPDGQYKIRIHSTSGQGISKEVATYHSGRVGGVEFKNGETYISSQGKSMPVSQVRQVDNRSANRFGSAKPLPMIKELSPKMPITEQDSLTSIEDQ